MCMDSLNPMRGYVTLLLLLSAVWGASYLFIKVGVRDFEPAAFVELGLLFAAPVLLGFLFMRSGVRGALRDLRDAAVPGLVLGTVNAAVPFALIAWGEKHVDSGVAGIRERIRASVQLPARDALRARGTGRPATAGWAADRDRWDRHPRRREPERRLVGGRGHARRRARVLRLRGGRDLRSEADGTPHRAGAGRRDDRRWCFGDAALRSPATALERTRVEAGRLRCGARDRRN